MSRQSDMTPCDIDETLISRIVIAHSISNLTHNRFWFGRGMGRIYFPAKEIPELLAAMSSSSSDNVTQSVRPSVRSSVAFF